MTRSEDTKRDNGARARSASCATLRRREEPESFVLGELAIDYDRRRVAVGASFSSVFHQS